MKADMCQTVAVFEYFLANIAERFGEVDGIKVTAIGKGIIAHFQ